MKAFITHLWIESKLALRGGDMIFFGVLFPMGIMALIGFISAPEAVQPGFGGVAAVGICAAGLMGVPLTFAGYRHEKILKRLKVTPVSPMILFLAVSVIQTVFAWVSGLGVYLIASLGFGVRILGSPWRYILTFLFVQVSVYSVGYLIAAVVPNIKTANLVCTVLYFPMLLLSGATVPFEILPRGLQVFAEVFPLTQGIMLLKSAVAGADPAGDMVRIIILASTALVCAALSVFFFRWE